jgi:predicted nucleic acid-binding protein
MRVVIADTSPIRYLVQCEQVDLLRLLFEVVTIPVEVANELTDASALPVVRAWMKSPPAWLCVMELERKLDPSVLNLDPGEGAAISLGIEVRADLILIDERKGNAVARKIGFATTGTLGILDLAAKRGLVDLKLALDRLKTTNFRYRQAILDDLLKQHGLF